MTRMEFYKENWKIGVHLVFRTKRFGVNNERWSTFDSMFGVSILQRLWDIVRIRPILRNYEMMKFRAQWVLFLTPEQCEILWPNYKEKCRKRCEKTQRRRQKKSCSSRRNLV